MRRRPQPAASPRASAAAGYPPSFLRRNRRIILTTFWLFLVSGTLLTLFETPAYRAVARVLVPPGTEAAAIRADVTYPDLLRAALADSDGRAVRLLLVQPPDDGGGGLALAAESADPLKPTGVAGHWADLYQIEELDGHHAHVTVIPPLAVSSPCRPKKLQNMLFAALLGTVVGIFLGFVADGVRAARRSKRPTGNDAVPSAPVVDDPLIRRQRRTARIRLAFGCLMIYTVVAALQTPTYRAVARLAPEAPTDLAVARFHYVDLSYMMANDRGEQSNGDGYYSGDIRQSVAEDGESILLIVETDDPRTATSVANDWAKRCKMADVNAGVGSAAVLPAVVPETPTLRTLLVRGSALTSLVMALGVLCLLAMDARHAKRDRLPHHDRHAAGDDPSR